MYNSNTSTFFPQTSLSTLVRSAPMLLDLLLFVRAANATAAEVSPTPQCLDINHCRTLQSIVFSCFSTVFLCTWSALHLNVPNNPKGSPFRRVRYMLGALLGPEVVFIAALVDWSDGSLSLKKILEHSPTCGWTETHVQFARMGGFRLKYADGETEFMRDEKLFDYVKDGTVDLPNISKDEILERSKGDFITKGITVIQTACQYLPLTELEVTTLSHTLMNLFIYWCWWHKPLGINFPIDVPSKKPRPGKEHLTVEGLDKTESERNQTNGNGDVVTRFLKPVEQEGEKSDALNDVLSFMSDKDEANPVVQVPRTPENDKVEAEHALLPSTSNNNNEKTLEKGNLAGPNSGDADATQDSKLDVEAARVTPPRLSLYTRLGIEVETIDDETLSPFGMMVLYSFLVIIGGAFGAIHCLAWNSEFPTRAEQYIWQVSSLLVTVIGGTVMVVAPSSANTDFWDKAAGISIATLLCLIYGFARVSLLILALLQLRALPYAAYVTPSWSIFYPHIY